MTSAVVPIDPQLEQKALSLPEQARAVRIIDQLSYERAGSLLLDVAAMRKEITEYHRPFKEKAFEAHRAICEAEKRMLAPITEAEQTLRTSVSAYTAEQRRKDEEARRAAALAAQREAEEASRKAALALQEQQRKDEAAKMAAALKAEKSGATPETVTAILEQPPTVTAEEIQAVLEEPVVVTAKPIESTFQAVKGLSQRDNWRWAITDASQIPRE